MLPLAGPRIALLVGVVETLLCGAVLATPHAGEPELRAVVRLTAMVSLLCFLAAFTASALVRRWPSPATRWMLANRRWLGLSFAASHAGHALALWQLARRVPAFGPGLPMLTRVFGGLGYVMIVLLAATSNDAAARWLGPRGWSVLHTTGVYVLWLDFLVTFAGAASVSPLHFVATASLVAALVLRRSTWRSRS